MCNSKHVKHLWKSNTLGTLGPTLLREWDQWTCLGVWSWSRCEGCDDQTGSAPPGISLRSSPPHSSAARSSGVFVLEAAYLTGYVCVVCECTVQCHSLSFTRTNKNTTKGFFVVMWQKSHFWFSKQSAVPNSSLSSAILLVSKLSSTIIWRGKCCTYKMCITSSSTHSFHSPNIQTTHRVSFRTFFLQKNSDNTLWP